MFPANSVRLQFFLFARPCDGCLSRLSCSILGSIDQHSFSLMGLRRGGALVIRVGIRLYKFEFVLSLRAIARKESSRVGS